jgi:hypothetical protein
MPGGFTAKGIGYQSGLVVIAGEYLGNSAVFGISTVSRQQLFLGYLRYGDSVSVEIVGSGFGSEVLIAEKDVASAGKIFVYDVGSDAFSQLDEISHTSGECWSAGTFRDKRYIVVEDGTDFNIYYWTTDDSPSTSVDGSMESGVYDFDLPEDMKQLNGFHVLSDSDSANKIVNVYYQLDEDGVWHQAGSDTLEFNEYLQTTFAETTVKFRTLRVRVDIFGGATVYSVSARMQNSQYQETWELLLDLTDESVDVSRAGRRRDSEDRGYQLRDYIKVFARETDCVLFKDGFIYPQSDGDDPDQYSLHAVNVDIPVDQVDTGAEGIMLVRLRSVDVNE